MLKVKEGFMLSPLGEEYVVVSVGKAAEAFNGMIRLNETGAFFWRELTAGTTEDALVQKLCARYRGLSEATARADLREFLDIVAPALEEV